MASKNNTKSIRFIGQRFRTKIKKVETHRSASLQKLINLNNSLEIVIQSKATCSSSKYQIKTILITQRIVISTIVIA